MVEISSCWGVVVGTFTDYPAYIVHPCILVAPQNYENESVPWWHMGVWVCVCHDSDLEIEGGHNEKVPCSHVLFCAFYKKGSFFE